MRPSYQIQSREEYHLAYQKSVEDPEAFWASIAEAFQWHKKWDVFKIIMGDLITTHIVAM